MERVLLVTSWIYVIICSIHTLNIDNNTYSNNDTNYDNNTDTNTNTGNGTNTSTTIRMASP